MPFRVEIAWKPPRLSLVNPLPTGGAVTWTGDGLNVDGFGGGATPICPSVPNPQHFAVPFARIEHSNSRPPEVWVTSVNKRVETLTGAALSVIIPSPI